MIVEARRDVITLRGSLTENEWPTIQAAAKMLLKDHPNGIIIDCGELTECTEEGARTFLDGIRYIQKHDARIIVAAIPENAMEVIRGVRAVVSQLPTAPTIEDARASLGFDAAIGREAGKGMAPIAALLVGDWERASGAACRIADRKRNELHLVELLKVPRTMPLATPLPRQEAISRRQLDDAERTARSYKLTVVRHVERVRSLAEGVQRVIGTIHPQTLVVAVRNLDEEGYELTNSVMPSILADPPCEIVYIQNPVPGE